MVTIHAPQKPKARDLKNVYEICNRIFKSRDVFYDRQEVEQRKDLIPIKE